jgi:hypothetical protein
VQGRGQSWAGFASFSLRDFVEKDVRYVQIRRQTGVGLYGFHRSSCSSDEQLGLGRWGSGGGDDEGARKEKKTWSFDLGL